mmetsp:Transcript_18488/g.33490  ORF Transcript_18488/g.33490 Transcript_18488/m.33490 type:complete len:343 (-) Transcript_18488:1213-2241(-)
MTMRPPTLIPRHLPSPSAVLSSVPSLLSLSTSCGWTHYGAAEWSFLANAGEVDGWVIDDNDGSLGVDKVDNDSGGGLLLGSILRVKYNTEVDESSTSGGHIWGLGMMLVDPKARRLGLGKALLRVAMDQCYSDDGGDHDSTILLGSATDLGRLMYEKMGYENMGGVTFLGRDANDAAPQPFESECFVKLFRCEDANFENSFNMLCDLDCQATGLDRTSTLRAALEVPGSVGALAFERNRIDTPIGAAVATPMPETGSFSIGPFVGDKMTVRTLVHSLASEVAGSGNPWPSITVKIFENKVLEGELSSLGFKVKSNVCYMTHEGKSLPRDKSRHLGLIHPTLG